jgi:ABC-2 type transport system permease protein
MDKVMYVFWAFLKKELRHVWRDKRSLVILVGMPVAMLLLFGFALTNEVKDSRIAILDYSRDEVTQTLIQRLDASRYFTVTGYINRPEEADQLFRQGKARAVLVFQENFQQHLLQSHSASVQILADAADTNTGSTVAFYAANVIRTYQNELLEQQKMPMRINLEAHMTYNPQLKSAFNFVPGVMVLILILLCAMLTAVAIVREKEMGTMELILVSPARPWIMIVTKAIPYLLVGFLNVLIILAMAYTILGLPMRGGLGLILAESALFVFLALSLGLLISTRTDSQQTALFISLVGLMLPSLIFSGFLFPLENMPKPLWVISHLVPTRYFYAILKSVMIKGLGFEYVWKPTLVLIGFTLLFLTLAVRSFKERQ